MRLFRRQPGGFRFPRLQQGSSRSRMRTPIRRSEFLLWRNDSAQRMTPGQHDAPMIHHLRWGRR